MALTYAAGSNRSQEGGDEWIVGGTVKLLDDADLRFGTGTAAGTASSGDLSMVWDGTTFIIAALLDDRLIEVGDAATPQLSWDVKWYGNAAAGAEYLFMDASASLIYTTGVDFQLKDNDVLAFGSGAGAAGDVSVVFDTTNLIIKAATDDLLIEVGDSATTQLSFDVKWYGGAASGASYLFADASADLIYTTGVDIQLRDNDVLALGSGAGPAGDVSVVWDTANLIVKAAVDDTLIEIGDSAATQLSFDVKWYGGAASGASYLFADADDDVIYTTGVDLWVKDADVLAFGNGASKAGDANVSYNTTSTAVEWAAAVDNQVMTFGVSDTPQLSFDLRWYGNAAAGAEYLYWDASDSVVYTTGVDLWIKDADILSFGDGASKAGDLAVAYNTTSAAVEFRPATDNQLITFGIAAGTQLSTDLRWYGDAAAGAEYLFWDASDSVVYTTGVDLWVKDADILAFGNGAGKAGDMGIQYNTTSQAVEFLATADDQKITFGVSHATQKSFDITVFGEAANGVDYALFDAGASRLSTAGAYYIGGRTDDAAGRGFVLSVRTTGAAPSTTDAVTGAIVFNTSESRIYVFNGTAWVTTSALT